jgi:hypothetical protein
MSILLDGLNGITTPAETVLGALTTTGNTILGDATTDTLNVGAGGLVKDASGNVGIGTASPAYKLDVSGIIRANSGYFRSSNTYTVFTGADILGTDGGMVSIGANPLVFGTNGTERMRIDSSGNLLVGTTSTAPNPGVAFYPNGGLCTGNSNGTTGFEFAAFRRNTAQIGSITQNGTTAVAYNTFSDYRLKENIAPMSGALDVVQALKPVTYNWKTDGSDGQGFIAHELQAVVPDCVTGEKDAVDAEGKPVHQGIDTSFLVATLTAAIQELKAIVDAQAVRIAALEV